MMNNNRNKINLQQKRMHFHLMINLTKTNNKSKNNKKINKN